MHDDQYFERLRGSARELRFEGDPFFPSRLNATVRSRIGIGSSVPDILFRWRRGIAVALLAMVMTAAAGAIVSTPTMTVDSIGSVADAGLMHEDIYRGAE
jgi:hypothetical protein